MPNDLEDTIRENAQGPAEARDEAGAMKQHSLRDQIEADRYLASKNAARQKGLGVRISKLVARGAPVAKGRAIEVRPVDPGAAPKDAKGSGRWAGRVVYRRCGVVLLPVSVGAPFPHVPVRVIQAKRVGLEPAHRRGEHVAVASRDRPLPVRELFLRRAVG
jgi:hypothetical protein